jgi:hypothetical protein
VEKPYKPQFFFFLTLFLFSALTTKTLTSVSLGMADTSLPELRLVSLELQHGLLNLLGKTNDQGSLQSAPASSASR